jgi:hypothetical protein
MLLERVHLLVPAADALQISAAILFSTLIDLRRLTLCSLDRLVLLLRPAFRMLHVHLDEPSEVIRCQCLAVLPHEALKVVYLLGFQVCPSLLFELVFPVVGLPVELVVPIPNHAAPRDEVLIDLVAFRHPPSFLLYQNPPLVLDPTAVHRVEPVADVREA